MARRHLVAFERNAGTTRGRRSNLFGKEVEP